IRSRRQAVLHLPRAPRVLLSTWRRSVTAAWLASPTTTTSGSTATILRGRHAPSCAPSTAIAKQGCTMAHSLEGPSPFRGTAEIDGVAVVTIPIAEYGRLLDCKRKLAESKVAQRAFERVSKSPIERDTEVA